MTTATAVKHSRILTDLQGALQRRYDVTVPYCVSQFVSHDSNHLDQLTGVSSDTPEMLLFQQNGDNLDITLFLDNKLLQHIDDKRFRRDWNGSQFDNCCIVLEGVSHFLYLVWNAHYDRQVRLLDVELQAEIDKFVFTSMDTNKAACSHDLIERLFSNVRFRKDLSPDLHKRYQQANQMARVYCEWLSNNFALQMPNRNLTAELARFYRLSGTAKQSYIRKLH